MGSENLFHKRKASKADARARLRNHSSRGNRYLIVSEGTKTEPNYFAELLNDWRIPHQLVLNRPSDDSSPNQVVACAERLYLEDVCDGGAYDAVFCVFDRDAHETFNAAVARIQVLARQGMPIQAITSNPCFELWFLLHFEYSTQPFHAAGKKTTGDQAVAKLKTKPGFKTYGKGQKNVYALLKDKIGQALEHAPRLRQHCEDTGSTNPVTDVDTLVQALRALRR